MKGKGKGKGSEWTRWVLEVLLEFDKERKEFLKDLLDVFCGDDGFLLKAKLKNFNGVGLLIQFLMNFIEGIKEKSEEKG